MLDNNKIYQLLDSNFVENYLNKLLLPKYPIFKKILKISISTPKKHVGFEDYYHIVIKYQVLFLTVDDKQKGLTFYAVAHSSELREKVHNVLNYLWTHNFNKGYLTIPRPLVFDKFFNASFYRGVDGHHLLYYLKNKNLREVEKIVVNTAKWFVKLHKLPVLGDAGAYFQKMGIATVVPGVDKVLDSIKTSFPEFYEDYRKLYKSIILRESEYLNSGNTLCLVHGDAHPENIIRMSDKKLALIDFADMCLGDFTRDLGTFLQQFEYMVPTSVTDRHFTQKMKDLFIDTYFKERGVVLTSDIKARIDNYYNWTILRTATYFFTKENPEYSVGEELFKRVRRRLLEI